MSSLSGLTEREAEAARKKYGVNVRSYKNSFIGCLRDEFASLTVRLVIISALLDTVSFMLGLLEIIPPFDSFSALLGKIFAAVLILLVGAGMRYSSGKILYGAFFAPPKGKYTVFRGGNKTVEISAGEITVGDEVFVSEGDVIPADGIVIDSTVTVEQSALGFPAKAEKTAVPDGYRSGTMDIKDPYSVYEGSAVCEGSAVIKITAIGDETQLARREKDNWQEIPEESFTAVKRISAAVGIIAAIAVTVYFMVSGALRKESFGGFMQGLSAASLTLAAVCAGGKALACEFTGAASVKKLQRAGISVTKAESLVSAGQTEILMTEREGMITEGKYSVSGFIDGSGKEYSSFSATGKHLGRLLKMAVKGSSKGDFLSDGTARSRVPLDKTLLGFVKGGKRENFKRQTETSENGVYGVTITIGSGLATIIRGRAEAVLERCGEYFGSDGKKHKITNKNAIQQLADSTLLGGKDIAAFGFSDRGIKGGKLPTGNFILIGFVVLQDGYPEESKESVKRLRKMGIRTMLVTSGSRRNSVFTVKYAGIKKSGGVVLDSEQLRKMSKSELTNRLEKTNAVTEASCRDKVRLSAAAKLKNKKICLAGSFTEDIPALEEADTAFASASAPPAVKAACGASADENASCGITCAAELISESRKFAGGYRFWIIFRAVLAAAISVGMLFL